MFDVFEFRFSGRKFLQNIIFVLFEMKPSSIHSNQYIINSQEISEQNIKTGWHHALQQRQNNSSYLVINSGILEFEFLTILTEHIEIP